ncbi:glycosyltransferase family 4 protein [Vibrio alginolyticus]|uniref:glycosyltransferase family 4 protein n=1 Tax=Vibrio TaxID=662 RepID=UPI001483AFB6|nr:MULTISPECIES: glycosyltransferase [Vibrio]MCA2450201.1 glycosyltransferase [Vibrio alginolyticus]MCA2473669.1 glycosyltransferase [Vibrio alginolyticus]MDW2153696.1 glycosyltransferase [Vibrio sp. 2092]MDW2230206.1 glycosyltransferase [Vibrio sp. 2091]NNN51845.1 glycosyltransferase [Vibrio sp. 2-2(7)]
MKVVHVIIGLRVGGAELMLKRLVEHSGGNIEHVIISLTDKGTLGQKIIDNGISVYCLNLNKLNFAFLGPIRLIKLLKRLKPQVVQTWMYHSDLIGGLCAKYIGVDKVIWSIRSTDIDKGGSKITVLIRKVLSQLSYLIPKKIVCAANKSKNIHIQVGYDKSKMIVIPNGFTKEKFEPNLERCESIKSQLGFQGEIIISSIGRHHPIKNHKLFIDSCNLLSENNKDKRFLFVMVGRGVNYSNEELKYLIENTNTPEKFILLDERDDVREILNISDIYCLHSLSEGFPNVLGEAMCLGKICVSTDVGDARDILISDELLVDLSDDDSALSYANALSRAVKVMSSRTTVDKISKMSIQRMEECFSIQSIVKRYEKLYSDL